jgi:hypothetical protein
MLLLALAAALCDAAQAADDAVPLGSDGCDHTFARAGNPECVSRFAQPGNTPKYCGYYVGGSCVCRGGAPGPLEGTFGWDYCGGHWCPHHVILHWCGKCKGGTGSYRTDGKSVPNIFAIHLPDRRCDSGAAGQECHP